MRRAPSTAPAPTPVMVGLGSNRCHGRHGRPDGVLRAAVQALRAGGLAVEAVAPIRSTLPLGPSDRRFANSALLGEWAGTAAELLALLKQTERDFGRRPGRRWGARVLDCDLLAFGGAKVALPGLKVPHPRLAERMFVLQPMRDLWPDWRHPETGRTVRHMVHRLNRPHPVDCPARNA